MSRLFDLFRRQVPLADLRVAHRHADRNRRRQLLELRRLGAREQILLEKIKEARRAGQSVEVDFLWEEMKVLRTDLAFVRRDLRVKSLETIALFRYVRGVERLERSGDRVKARKLLERIRSSGLERKLAANEVREEDYLSELDSIFQDVGLEVSRLETDGEDPEKEAFLQEIDALVAAEECGDRDAALQHEGSARALVDPGD